MIHDFTPISKYFTCFYHFREEDCIRKVEFDNEDDAKKFVIKAFFDSEIYLLEVQERYVYGVQRWKKTKTMPMFKGNMKEEVEE